MLKLYVNGMRDGQQPFERIVPPSALPPEDDYRVVEPLELSLLITKDKAKLEVAGSARTVLELACSRCLDGHRVPVTAEFDLLYLPLDDAPAGGEELEVADEDVNTAFYRDGVIDLAEMVHEQLYLALPMKPLCREDCRGLCPACGVNRNTTDCGCDPRWQDPRLSALEALLKDRDDA